MSKKIYTAAILGSILLPLGAYAAPTTFAGLVYFLISFINPMAEILASVALLIFFWGIVQYIFSPGGEGHEKARQLILWGIIALFVLFSVWSLARILVSTFASAGSAGSGPTGTSASGAPPSLIISGSGSSGSQSSSPIVPPWRQ